ncbi:MAG: hypothetical protein LBV45_03330 [Xanthomonadaceae bacterium]|jgi:hypothetical protein|nr:hypothetical protein [Xanthomonadaceae bacterium]
MNTDKILEIINNNKIPEFGKFLLGEYPYFVESSTGNEEPQNVPEAFDALIFSAWREKNPSNLSQIFVQALLWMLDNSEDENKSVYVAGDWIWYYKFCWNKQENDPKSIYRGIFLLDLHQVANKIKEKLIEKKNLCKKMCDGPVRLGIVSMGYGIQYFVKP